MGKYIIASTNFWVGLLAAMFIVQIVDRFDLIDKAKPLFGTEVTTEEIVDLADDPIVDELGFFGKRGKINREMMDAYVKRWSHIAVLEQKKYGIPASISLAQGLIESASGTSFLCKNGKNHFGMKCFAKGHTHKNKHKGAGCINRHDDKATDYFRIFETDWAAWRAHSLLLATQPRYKKLFKYGLDYKKWAHGLGPAPKGAGYATSPKYPKDLITLIETLNLQRFDAAN